MENEEYKFNLEFHLLEWKRGFRKTWLAKEDIEELTQHLRDHFDELCIEGHTANEAWHIAIRAMGSHKDVVKEFNKVWYNFMQNTILYNIVALVPGILLFQLARSDYKTLFVVTFVVYALVYRTFVDYLRLRSKHVIDRNQLWVLLVPGSRIKYFLQLYFNY